MTLIGVAEGCRITSGTIHTSVNTLPFVCDLLEGKCVEGGGRRRGWEGVRHIS